MEEVLLYQHVIFEPPAPVKKSYPPCCIIIFGKALIICYKSNVQCLKTLTLLKYV